MVHNCLIGCRHASWKLGAPLQWCGLVESMFCLQVHMMAQSLNPGDLKLKVQLSPHDWEGDGAELSFHNWLEAGLSLDDQWRVIGGKPLD